MKCSEMFSNSELLKKFRDNTFSIKNLYVNNSKIKRICILNMCFYIKVGTMTVPGYFEKTFKEYFETHDMKAKIQNLKNGLDNISCQYIDKFMTNSKYWNKYTNKPIQAWTAYDMKLKNEFKSKNFEQPFPEIGKFDSFIFHNLYGLKDLPADVLEKINGKDIIDAGGYYGDTAVMFAQNFPDSKVYVYEPLKANIKLIELILEKDYYKNRIIPIQKGLGDKSDICEISFNYTNSANIEPLDKDYTGDKLGLIKIDTEGFESKIIKGSSGLIKKYKPVLAIAIYHTPEDFFELKDKLSELNPEYKFLIRRSEQIIPTADIILIAY